MFSSTARGQTSPRKNLRPLREAVLGKKAAIGLATDGDADRFGILDADGDLDQPNHILALLYDYVVESARVENARGAQRGHFALHGRGRPALWRESFQTPVGFKYIGELIQRDKIAMGGEESAGLSIRGHVPEKDGILACLLIAEMVAVRRTSLAEQLRALFSAWAANSGR